MVKNAGSFKRLMLAVLVALCALCSVFTAMSFNGKTALAADFSYQEGRDGYTYNSDGSLSVKFTVTGGGNEIYGNFIKWIVYLIDENTGITYNPTTHKYTDNTDRSRSAAAYCFPVDASGGTGTKTVSIAANVIAYNATSSSPSSSTDYGTNTGKTFSEVFEQKNWIVGVGPMFSNWWGGGYTAVIDYYVGRAADVLFNTVAFRDYDESLISSSSLSNTDGITVPSYTTLDANNYEFLGWYCDTTDKIYSAAQIADLKVSDVINSTKTANFYAAYNQKFSKYIEFTTYAIDGYNNQIDAKIVDTTDSVADTVTVKYDITHNDGANSLVLIPEYDKDMFTLESISVKSDTVLGAATLSGDDGHKILLEGETLYNALDAGFITLTFSVKEENLVSGDYTFGLKFYPKTENNSSVAYYWLDGTKLGEQEEIGVTVVTNTLNVSAIKDSTIRSREEYIFTYSKTPVSASKVDNYTYYDYNNKELIVYFGYDGDATSFTYNWYENDGVTPTDAPMYVGDYVLEIIAPQTTLYKSSSLRVDVSIVPRELTVTIADKTSEYLDAILPLTSSVDGTVYAGDEVETALSTTATSSSSVGEYAITGVVTGGNNNSQYHVTFVDGVYTIAPRAITITAGNQNATYNGSEPEVVQSAYTVTHIVDNETVGEDLPAGATVVLTKAAGVNVGTYDIVPSSVYFVDNANYAVTYVNGTFTIESVTTGEVEVIKNFFEGIDGNPYATTYNGLYQKLVVTTTATPDWVINHIVDDNGYYKRDAGAYDDITVTLYFNEQDAANYTAGVQNIVFTIDAVINKAAITVSADAKTANYGDDAKELTYAITSGTLYDKAADNDYNNENLSEDTLNVTLTTETIINNSTPVGIYDIVIGATNANYNITLVDNTYTIVKATVSDTDDDGNPDDASDENLENSGLKISLSATDVYYNRNLIYSYKVMVGTQELEDSAYTVKFYSNSACTNEVVPENAGTYYIKVAVADTANYDGGSKVVQFVINKIRLAAPGVTYDGATFTLSPVTTDIEDVDLKEGTQTMFLLEEVEDMVPVYNLFNGTHTATQTGRYYYRVSSSNNDNYLAYDGSTEICYSIAFTEGSHEYNPTALTAPDTMYCFNTSSIVLPEALSLDGYNFVSWGGNDAESVYAPTANVTFDAIWNAIEYTIAYKYTDDGAVVYEHIFYYGETATYPTATVVPVKDSDDAGIYYTFANKWTANSVEYDAVNGVVAGYIITDDVTFVAVFDTNYNSFTVTYYVSHDGATSGYSVYGAVQQVTYLNAIDYRTISENVVWFKVDAWYLNADRTTAVPANMPNHNISVYGTYKFDIGAGDVNADGRVNADDITLYRQWIVGGYTMTPVENGNEWATAQAFDSNTRYFLKRVADINVDGSKDVRDVSITRMSTVNGYNWDILTGENVTGNEIARTYQSTTVNEIANRLNGGKRVILGSNVDEANGVIAVNYNGNIYLDLNGKTLTVESLALIANGSNATITVKNGTIVTTLGVTLSAPNGNVIITDVTAYDANGEINLQAADSSLHMFGAVKFYKGNSESTTPAAVKVEEGTHVVVEADAEIVIAKIIVTENHFEVPEEPSETAVIVIDNKTDAEIEIQGNSVNEITDVAGLVSAAKLGGAYTLKADVIYSGSVVFTADATINLNGYTLRSTNNVAIFVANGVTLTLDGNGNVIAQEACVMPLGNSTVIINGGTYTARDNFVIGTNGTVSATKGDYGHNVIIINGGTFNGNIETAGYVACGIYVANSDTVTVNGGTFNVTNGVGILARSGNTTVGENVVFNVTGNGTLGKVGDSKVTVPSGKILVVDYAADYPGGAPVLVNNSTYEINDLYVVKTGAELNALRSVGGYIIIGANIDYTDSVIFYADATINLNKHILQSTNNVALKVSGGATLTIVGDADGQVRAQEACVMAFDGSTVIINGGTYTAIDNFVVGTNGSNGRGNNTIVINGGTFNGNITTAGYVACGIYVANSDTVTVNAGTFNVTNGVGILARSGNTTVGANVVFNVTGNGTLGKVGDSKVTVPSGEVLVLDIAADYPGGIPTLTNNSVYTVYTKNVIGNINDLIAAIYNGGDYTLTENIIYNGQASFAKDTILNLNGKTLQSTNAVALSVTSGATLTINGNGNVKAQEMCVMAFDGSTVIINGGTYTAYDNAVFGTNGLNGRGNNNIVINGGTFNGNIESAGYVACGIYVANSDTVTVNAGTFNVTNGVGILARSGNTTVGENVVFNVTGDGTLGKVGDSKVTVPSGEALVLDLEANYPGGAPSITNNSEYAVYTVSAN